LAADKIKVPDDAGPYDVSLSLGRFPFDWELYDYAKNAGGAWAKVRLGGGSNFAKVRLPQGARADLAGHSLVWSVTVVNLDEQVHATELTVSLVGPGGKPSVVKATFEATPERPHLFVSVQVEP
jgi:hypothetical protein